MKDYATYVEGLASLVELTSDRRRIFDPRQVAPALDGEASRALRKLVSLEVRRRDGAFFTGTLLAEKVASALSGELSANTVLTDPACGGGDLLLAAATHLPRKIGLSETLDAWGKNLRGTDIHAEFVHSTKFRLVLKSLALGAERTRIGRDQAIQLFPLIRVSDGLSDVEQLRASTHVVTNPPFSMVPAPIDCEWTSGTVNCAAIFLEFITRSIEPGTRILAILPDVLRSGSRYAKWRELVLGRLSNVRFDLFGQFSQHADVDVFFLNGKRRLSRPSVKRTQVLQRASTAKASFTVGDRFDVHVGAVVPHRHKKKGREYPFLTPHNSPPWGYVGDIDTRRCFAGTVYTPPFVVIRRTSRSNDLYRAVGTVVAGVEEVAVENHLIVAIPHSGLLHDCYDLLHLLKSAETSNWLNKRICCRHLTVSSVNSIPWILEAE